MLPTLLETLTEDDLIQKEFEALLDDYSKTNHRQKIEIITKAFTFARSAHKGIKRRSGNPILCIPWQWLVLWFMK
jgi:GTP pyrophosphokinase